MRDGKFSVSPLCFLVADGPQMLVCCTAASQAVAFLIGRAIAREAGELEFDTVQNLGCPQMVAQ